MSVAKYLEKHGKALPLLAMRKFRCAVVIPAMAESESLPHTLQSLAANSPLLLEDTMTIVVVNQPLGVNQEIRSDNEKTLRILAENPFQLQNLHFLDLATPNGVGGARKAGMDSALAHLDWNLDPLIFCLDADTLVEPNYLQAASRLRGQPGAIVNFCHQLPEDPMLRRAVMEYELFMRYYVLGLRWAASPYAFHSLGSAMICRAADYARCGGMRERNGGEDFYFLQSLRKLGPIGFIGDTTIYPAGRLSDRVDFGTGPRLRKLMAGEKQGFYHIGIFIELKKILSLMPDKNLPERLSALRTETQEFFRQQKFMEAWPRILRNTPKNAEAARWAFHTWLDGFRTLKLIHHLEREIPMLQRVDYRDGVMRLCEHLGHCPPASADLAQLLAEFRQMDGNGK